MKLFTFKIKVQKVNGLGVTGEHDVFVVADDMEQSLVIFNKEFEDDDVTIQAAHQSPCKVLVQRKLL